MAVLLLWLLDASNNTAMEPYRAFLADKLPDAQLARGFLCSIGSVPISVLSTPKNPPSPDALAILRAQPRGLTPFVRDIGSAVRDMPASLPKLGLVYLFQWFAIVIYWQYVSLVVAKSVFNTTPRTRRCTPRPSR